MTRVFVLSILVILSTALLSTAQVTASATSPKRSPTNGLTRQITSGKKIYTKYCLNCHQADGLGIQSMNPPLSKTVYVLGPKEQLIRVVLGGFNDQIEINGDLYINAMPSFQSLTDKEVADLLTYVRNSFGNKASAINASDVKKTRAKLFK